MNDNIANMQDELKELQDTADSIRFQLEMAKVRRKQGTPYNQEWFVKAEGKLRTVRRHVQDLQKQIGEARRVQRLAEAKNLEHKFLAVAKRRLDQELYEELVEEARMEM